MRIEFTLDCNDLDTQARFWAAALGCDVEGGIEGRYIALSGPGIGLALQRVPEAKTVKNRMHIDLLVDDVPAEVGRLESLGATRMTPAPHQEFGQTWYVMADPEGNEFCVARDPSTKPPHPE
jgi:predicted enzyme related to lactoylglutathione lyase